MKNSKIMVLVWGLLLTGSLISGCGSKPDGPPALPEKPVNARLDLGGLAYVKGGNLWVKELPDGTAKQLTIDGDVTTPRWSPSGEWLLFQKKDQLWLTGPDGSEQRMVDGQVYESAWSAREDVIFYASEKSGLASTRPDSGESRVLIKPAPGTTYGRLVNSPDGRYIAFEMFRQPDPMTIKPQGVWKLDTDSGEVKPVYKARPYTQNAMGTMPHLAGWSSDGKVIYLWVGPQSGSTTADGIPFTAVAADTGKPVLVGKAQPDALVYKTWFAAAPDPNRAAVITGGGREAWTAKKLSVVDLRNNKITAVSGKDQAVSSYAISPDGSALAYSANPDQVAQGSSDDYSANAQRIMMQRKLWVVKPDGGSPRQLTNDNNYQDEYPVWTGQGDYILFARFDKEDKTSLWMMGADGSNPKLVAEDIAPGSEWFGFYGYLDWSQAFDYHK